MTAENHTATEGNAAAAADTPESAPMTSEQRHAAAERLVRSYTLGGMAVALVPVPLVDLAGLMAVQLKMLHGLARLYSVAFRADLGRSAAASLVGGALPTAVAPALAASLGKLVPVSGQLLGGGSLAVASGAATYALGKVFIQHFAAGGTFLTFDPEAVRDYFQQQFEAGKQVAAELKPKSRRGARKAGTDDTTTPATEPPAAE
ncbi:MAG: DUF697 domain-containing protein [Thiohalocapsa sp.]|uniref:YcjF family protein n=1 Tax=Thiohalocapsa sp. TaxID=2497641 RepID=UPI0025EBE070|nr:DUF697 domain-containing protein [Thiohalocapsa sp.]MCG6940948.1 DUF697 domain-containing protein [Thiohalocapsa sp.]